MDYPGSGIPEGDLELFQTLIMQMLKMVLALALLVVISGCRPRTVEPTKMNRLPNGAEFFTVPHDGHDFVIVIAASGTSMLHHPSCPCSK